MSKICDRAAGGPGSADAVAPLAASQSCVCEHPDDSAGAGRASVAGPPDCGGPPGALAAEVAARQPVRDVPSQHAGTAPTGAGGMIPWGYFAAIAAFARLRPRRRDLCGSEREDDIAHVNVPAGQDHNVAEGGAGGTPAVNLLHNPLLLCLVGVGHCDAGAFPFFRSTCEK